MGEVPALSQEDIAIIAEQRMAVAAVPRVVTREFLDVDILSILSIL